MLRKDLTREITPSTNCEFHVRYDKNQRRRGDKPYGKEVGKVIRSNRVVRVDFGVEEVLRRKEEMGSIPDGRDPGAQQHIMLRDLRHCLTGYKVTGHTHDPRGTPTVS